MESHRKVVIVGAGQVGAAIGFNLMKSGLIRELVFIDVDRDRAQGEAEDMNHGLYFAPPITIRAGDYDDCKDAAVVVHSAGLKRKPGQTRLELTNVNVQITRQIVREVTQRTRDAVLLVVANPVDIVTHYSLKFSGLPAHQVLGSGTMLDSTRLRYLLSRHYGVDARNIEASIVGEHGDSEVPLWSQAHIAGLPMENYCESCRNGYPDLDKAEVLRQVKDAGEAVIRTKGATYFAVSLAVERIVGAILRDEHSVLTVSSHFDDFLGVHDVCLSLPAVLSRKGVDHVIWPDFSPDEREGLRRSAQALRSAIDEVERTAGGV